MTEKMINKATPQQQRRIVLALEQVIEPTGEEGIVRYVDGYSDEIVAQHIGQGVTAAMVKSRRQSMYGVLFTAKRSDASDRLQGLESRIAALETRVTSMEKEVDKLGILL